MVRGVGNDIIEIERLSNAIKRHGKRFLDRIFTEQEQTYCLRFKEPSRHFAARFAAKEAVAKALGTGFGANLAWNDIEIERESSGKPICRLSNSAAIHFDYPTIEISLSHCQSYASAVAIVQ